MESEREMGEEEIWRFELMLSYSLGGDRHSGSVGFPV